MTHPTDANSRSPPRQPHVRATISLLHATYHRERGPLEVKESWIGSADRPDLIEYIVALDADDDATLLQTKGHHRVVGPPGGGRVTSVRNWNAAAAESSGDLLMVIADDLFPPPGWDTTLVEIIEPLDPVSTPFAVKVADSPARGDTLLRHPVVSRAFYARHGLFSAGYDGVFCDVDITTRAFWRAVILDGRSLTLEHRHPSLNGLVERSESQSRVNSVQEQRHGRDLYVASWTRRQRSAPPQLIRAAPTARLNGWVLRALRWRNWVWATVTYPVRIAAAIARLILRPPERR